MESCSTSFSTGCYGDDVRVNYVVTRNGSTGELDSSVNPLSGGIGFIEFEDGETSQAAFRIYAQLDNDFDPGESITISLFDPDPVNGAQVVPFASTTVTFINTNPSPGTVQFSAASYSVDENQSSVTVTVTRGSPTVTDMNVSYAVIGGTATAGNAETAGTDYLAGGATSGTLSFTGESTTQTITIPLVDDPNVEDDETIQLQLTNPTAGGALGATAFTTVIIRDIQPQSQPIVPKLSGKVAFVSSLPDASSSDLVVANSNGTSPTNITNTANLSEIDPAWSPNGAKLAYSASDFQGDGGASGIYVINANGTGRVQLTQSGSDIDPVWSPDGALISFVRLTPDSDLLMVMNADGSNVRQLFASNFIVEPKWSPDGSRIIYTGRVFQGGVINDAVIEVGIDGFGGRIVYPAMRETRDASYTPDGTQLVFRGILNSVAGIYRARVDGTGAPQLVATDRSDVFLSPDGTRIIYTDFSAGNGEVFVSDVNGTQATNITNSSGFEGDAAWQPLAAC